MLQNFGTCYLEKVVYAMRKINFFLIGSLIILLSLIAYWTIIPRSGVIDISGEGVYTGELRGMTYHGYGNYTSYAVNGTSYEGEWENGIFHGKGTLTFADGSKLVGNFNEGLLNGMCLIVDADGREREVWFDNYKPKFDN
jgi:hypothetical protein